MKITIDVIAEALKEYQPIVQLSSFNRQYSRLRLAKSEEWDSETLYIVNGKKTPPVCGIKNSGLICIGRPNASPDETSDLLVLPERYDIYDIFNYIQNIFDSFAGFEVDLLNASTTGSYKEIIDVGWKFIKNPLFLQESGHRIITLAPETDIPSDPEWDFLRKNRFIPIESIQKLKNDGYLNTFKSFKTATLFSSSSFPFPFIVSNISVDFKFTGRLVVVGSLKPFSSADVLASKILSEIIEHKMNMDDTYKFPRRKGPVYSMLHDLINGLKIDSKLIANYLQQYLPDWMNGSFRVLFIQLDQVDDPTYDYYARILEKHVDGCSILYENALVFILHYIRETDLSSIIKIITSFLSDNSLIGGMSNKFSMLTELHEFYLQSAAALKFAKGTKKIYIYEDYMLRHVFSYFPPENIPYLCHPSVFILKQYDREHNTQFSETLQIFLKNERSIVKAAKALFIHRNTLLNRIDRMMDILDIDLEDPDTRLHILLSYKLLTVINESNNLKNFYYCTF